MMDSKFLSDRTNMDPSPGFSQSLSYSSNLFNSMSSSDKPSETSISDENSYESRKKIVTGLEIKEDGEETQVIQILLPCIICNRTFSPEALERHSKVCTKVNVKVPWKPERGVFDSTEQRIKGTKVADFIPPPTTDALTDSLFSRRCRNRASLRGTSCTTRSTLNYTKNSPLNSPVAPTNTLGSSQPTAPWRRSRSLSRAPEEKTRKKSDTSVAPDDNSDYGSNTSDENQMTGTNNRSQRNRAPSYLQSLSPQEFCPYCNRSFGLKAYDRHVSFCKEVYERKQYELQPIPPEKEEALQRQEIRTKYRPMKSSTSLTSLRSMSPARDFANMACKFFGLRRSNHQPRGNYYAPNIIGSGKYSQLKKSNESIASSTYTDFQGRNTSSSPAPVRRMNSSTSFNTYINPAHHERPKVDSLMNSSYHPPSSGVRNKPSMLPLRVNSVSGPKKTRSIEHIPMKSPYSHVNSSGYGQLNPNFTRNSKNRATVQSTQDFFRANKRVEPEGTENTTGSNSDHPSKTSPLIITSMNLFSKPQGKHNESDSNSMDGSGRQEGRKTYGQLYSEGNNSSSYDPYEKAAKQLEELLKSQPVCKLGSSKKTTRRLGLEKAFESVGVPSAPTIIGDEGKKGKGSYATNNDHRPSASLMGRSMYSYERQRSSGNNSTAQDNYWDEILERRDKMGHSFHQEGPQQQTTGADKIRSDEGIKSLLSDSSLSSELSTMSSGDSAFVQGMSSGVKGQAERHKSRAQSNVSSADSAFSRSEGKDLEFEVLENLVSRGDISNTSTSPSGDTNSNNNKNNSITTSSPTTPLYSLSRVFNTPTKESKESPPNDRQSPMDESASMENTDTKFKTGAAKFCHECGVHYPTSTAKFCPECGERRIFHV